MLNYFQNKNKDKNNTEILQIYDFKHYVITNNFTNVYWFIHHISNIIIPNSITQIEGIYFNTKDSNIILPNSIRHMYNYKLPKKYNIHKKILNIFTQHNYFQSWINHMYFNHKCTTNILFAHSVHIPIWLMHNKNKKYPMCMLLINLPNAKLESWNRKLITREKYFKKPKKFVDKIIDNFIETIHKCIKTIHKCVKTTNKCMRGLFKK